MSLVRFQLIKEEDQISNLQIVIFISVLDLHTNLILCWEPCSVVMPWAQNLRQGIVKKTSFKTRVSRMGLHSFVNINIFVMKYIFFQFDYIFHFFQIS